MENIFLTTRELEIFQLLARNFTTKEIAELLKISEKTARNHISNVIGKLGVSSRTQALVELIKYEIIDI